MRGADRRRSSPPPRRDDRGPPGGGRGRYPPPPRGAGDRRRPRSISPPPGDRFRRSPPPPKRFRGREPDHAYPDHDRYGPGSAGRDAYGRRGGYGPGGYRGRVPDERYDRSRSPPPRSRDQPMVFREFMMTLSDDVTPEAAKEAFNTYLANWWGDAIKAEFEQRKSEQGLRKRFDPREIQKLMTHRNDCAKAAAAKFAEELAEGRLDYTDESFNQGDDGSAPGPEGYADIPPMAAEEPAPSPARAPALCWAPAQLAADLALARQVMQLLDKEKGIESNPLLAADDEPAAADAAAEAAGKKPVGEEMAEGADAGKEGEEAEGEGGEEAAAAHPAAAESAEQQELSTGAAPAENGSAAEAEGQQQPAEVTGKLDQALTYLWRVHGIDYYGGREYYDPEEPGRAVARRTLRQPAPPLAAPEAAAQEPPAAKANEGEATAAAPAIEDGPEKAPEGEDGADKAAPAPAEKDEGAGGKAAGEEKESKKERDAREDRERYDHRVTGFWRYRLEHPDPLEPPLQRKRVEEQIESFIEEQIIKHEENKWGNKLSNKLFVAREFVVKHIRNKHGHVLDTERDKILDAIFFDNFKAFKEEEQRRRREEEEAKQRRQLEGQQGADAEIGEGGRGRGMGAMAPLLDPSAALMMDPMGGMMMADPMAAMALGAGQIFVPGPAGLTPVLMAPMDMGMMMGGGIGMGSGNMMGGSGGRGGRGGRVGGRGPMRGRGVPGMGGPVFMGAPGAKLDAGGVREYFDLDAPANNRAVLDYGDL